MVQRFLLSVLMSSIVGIIGCGATDDEGVRKPTPTQGPPTPTPLPICQGLDVPPGLGARAFTWEQPGGGNDAGTQLFSTLPAGEGVFAFLPSLQSGFGLDPGGNTTGRPPGFCLLAGAPDANGVASVTIGVTEENQLIDGHFVIGIKPILDYICLKIELESVDGKLYCQGRDEGIDTRTTAAAGVTPFEDDVLEFSLGDSAPAGSLELRVRQQQGRINNFGPTQVYQSCVDLPECGPGERFNCYRPEAEVSYTTGTVLGMKGDTPLLGPDLMTPGISGEPFDCDAWTTTDGPGRFAQGLVDFDATGGDVATALRIDD